MLQTFPILLNNIFDTFSVVTAMELKLNFLNSREASHPQNFHFKLKPRNF